MVDSDYLNITVCSLLNEGFFLNDSGLTLNNFSDNISTKYLDLYLIWLNKKIYSISRWQWQRNLDMDKLKKINVAFPTSLTEQQKIVDYLDGKFTSIDNIEKEVEEYGKKLDDLEKGILKELLYNAKYQKIQLEDVIQLNYWKSISWKLSDDWNIPVYWSNWIYWYTKEESIVNEDTIVIWRKGSVWETHIIKSWSWVSDTAFFVWFIDKTGNYLKSVDYKKLAFKTKNNILYKSILFFLVKNYGI